MRRFGPISRRSFRASRRKRDISARLSSASFVYAPCLSALVFPCGAPDPLAPPCMRQRFLLATAGERHAVPARVFAPQRGLASIGAVFRLCFPVDSPLTCASFSLGRTHSAVAESPGSEEPSKARRRRGLLWLRSEAQSGERVIPNSPRGSSSPLSYSELQLPPGKGRTNAPLLTPGDNRVQLLQTLDDSLGADLRAQPPVISARWTAHRSFLLRVSVQTLTLLECVAGVRLILALFLPTFR
jgi:hypothetical protein